MIVINCFDNQGIPAIVPDDQRGQHDLFLTLIKKSAALVFLSKDDQIVLTSKIPEILGSRGVNLAFFFAFHRYFVRCSVAGSIKKE